MFASYVGVLVDHLADGVPELMASMVTTTRVSQDFSDLSWVRYNASICGQAAVMGYRN